MLTIGEFSKICQVSVKTLRHYDKINLLKPMQVDVKTGYRYYETVQLERMLLISRLKRYGLPLEEIRLFLDCDDDDLRLATLKRQVGVLQQVVRDQTLVLKELSAYLENFERNRNIMDYQKHYDVNIVTAPEVSACTCRQVMGVKEFGNYYGSIFEHIAREQLTPNGIVGAVYYDSDFDPEATDIELFVGIVEANKATKTIGGQRCAFVLHRGAYHTLTDAYAAMVSWFEENNYTWDGAPFEIYRKNQFNGLNPEEWETEIYFPIQEKNV